MQAVANEPSEYKLQAKHQRVMGTIYCPSAIFLNVECDFIAPSGNIIS